MVDPTSPMCPLHSNTANSSRNRVPIGLGTAGLFSLPTVRQRQAILRRAYEIGIRHFDVAPIYGLGRAESELASIIGSCRSDITVTSKVGLYLTPFASALGYCQQAPRAILRRLPSGNAQLKRSAAGPDSGKLGSAFYTSSWDAQRAQASLRRSLARLDTDYLDYFLVHDPSEAPIGTVRPLLDFLSETSALGTVKFWGLTGTLSHAFFQTITGAGYAPPIHQLHDDVFSAVLPAAQSPCPRHFTFGALARPLPLITGYLVSDEGPRRYWNNLFGFDLLTDGRLSRLLLAEALRRNPGGTILISTTQPRRLLAAIAATEDVRTGLAEELSPVLHALTLEVSRPVSYLPR